MELSINLSFSRIFLQNLTGERYKAQFVKLTGELKFEIQVGTMTAVVIFLHQIGFYTLNYTLKLHSYTRFPANSEWNLRSTLIFA